MFVLFFAADIIKKHHEPFNVSCDFTLCPNVSGVITEYQTRVTRYAHPFEDESLYTYYVGNSSDVSYNHTGLKVHNKFNANKSAIEVTTDDGLMTGAYTCEVAYVSLVNYSGEDAYNETYYQICDVVSVAVAAHLAEIPKPETTLTTAFFVLALLFFIAAVVGCLAYYVKKYGVYRSLINDFSGAGTELRINDSRSSSSRGDSQLEESDPGYMGNDRFRISIP